MASHAAFLRGVNLGKRRRVSNAALKDCFEGLGLADAECFRASGNVVFTSGGGRAAELKRRIEAGLGEALGFEVEVVLRTAARLRATPGHEPFPAKEVGAADGKLQVILGSGRLGSRAERLAAELATDADRLATCDGELYWLPLAGVQGSTLDQRAIDEAIGPVTVRTKGTVDQIASKYFS